MTTQGQVLGSLLRESGFEVISVSSRLNRVLRMVDIILTLVWRRKSIDLAIVEIYSGMSFLIADAAGLIGKYLSIPTVGVLHGGNLPEFSSTYSRWSLRVLRRFDRLVAPSPFLKRVAERRGLGAEVIPNVIDLGRYPFKLRERTAPQLIWMRAFHSIYNPFLAIEAFALIQTQYPDATLVMAGVDKGLESDVKKLARDAGVDDKMRFPGFLDMNGKVNEFSNADIYLNTNDIDNMPVTVLEACALGLPVVATDVGGIKDLLNDGVDALLVAAGDAPAIASAVHNLIDDPDLSSRLSLNGRTLAELSSWTAVKAEWEALFHDMGLSHSVLTPVSIKEEASA